MKYRLLDWLICPACGYGQLKVEAFRVNSGESSPEVVEGLLNCSGCGSFYPVVGGVPRMLPDSFIEHSLQLRQFRRRLPSAAQEDSLARDFKHLHKSTQATFAFEWLRYRVTDFEENARFFGETMGVQPEELKDKLVLDAGCGMGRFMEVAASWGAEVVGIDLSRSVERAWRETRCRPRIHLVQGDLMRPPLRAEMFDFVYSIGVLHHTPDTRRAFQSVCPLIRRGGRISIWVYRTFQPEIPVAPQKRFFAFLCQQTSDVVRMFTTRMPHLLLHYLCYAAVPLGWVKRLACENRSCKYLLWPFLLLPVSVHRKWWMRLCETFDWLSPQYQWKHTTPEVVRWFEQEGLLDVRSQPRSVSVTGVKPVPGSRPSPRAPGTRRRERVKILQFVNFFLIGGTEQHVVRLARKLDASRFEVQLACLSRSGELLEEMQGQPIPIREYPITSIRHFRTLKEQLCFARDLHRHPVQIVHTYGFYPNVFAIPPSRLAGSPIVVASIRDMGDMWTPMQRRLQKLVCRLAHCIAVNSEAVRRHLLSEGYPSGKIVVIRNGVDLSRFSTQADSAGSLRRELGVPGNGPIVAVVSRLNNRIKGVHYFLEAAALIARQRHDVHFLIVGDGPLRQQLEAYALRLGLASRMRFAGFRLDVAEILPQLTISVLPSLSEGLSNVLLESLAAQVPVVATRVGGNPEVLEDGATGILVPPADPLALAEAVCFLLENPQLACQLAEAGRERVAREFSLERMLAQTEKLYLGLLESASSEELCAEFAGS